MLMHKGKEVFTLNITPLPEGIPPASLRAVRNALPPTKDLHSEPLPSDKGKHFVKVVPPDYMHFSMCFPIVMCRYAVC